MSEISVGMRRTVSLYRLFSERYGKGGNEGDTVQLAHSRIVWSGDSSIPEPKDYYDLYDETGKRHLFGMDGETVIASDYDGDTVTLVFENDETSGKIAMTSEEFRTAAGL